MEGCQGDGVIQTNQVAGLQVTESYMETDGQHGDQGHARL